ncbi:MAG TPA: bifunctional phosphoribosylaminoimidazolecarboxamide formyltransferase/IMP cyclohydrolase [Limnochordales bacterium]|nr:bifunctional phosphoribosylaminoimidazolecarboxamide formyltransferase/IMP cyclohydrolase [Limnochordales bacterium]
MEVATAQWGPRRALISVSDKRGVVEFARGLVELGFEIVSTGGTAAALKDHVPVTQVSAVTGFPEVLDGRVKTLHPAIHAGILARRDREDDMRTLQELAIAPFDVVAVNLYPFAETVSRPGCTFAEAMEQIDIGGPALVRAAAKNHPHVWVVVNPDRYGAVLAALAREGAAAEDGARLRRVLAREAFAHTAAYDAAIASYLSEQLEEAPGAAGAMGAAEAAGAAPPTFPERWQATLVRAQALRYGENPHQAAAFYVEWPPPVGTIAAAQQLQGKELSFNNIHDAHAALELVREFDAPAVAAVKHANPCGLAVADTVADAFVRARDADPVSIFGGIVAANRPIDAAAARAMRELFLEVIIAPDFTAEAREVLAARPSLRLLRVQPWAPPQAHFDWKRVGGGLLVQEADWRPEGLVPDRERVVTRRAPTPAEWDQLEFAWKVVKHVKSNAIVLARDWVTVGIGAGQMSRIAAARLAIEQAGARAKGAVLASEAFFPFPDVVEAAARAGVTAIVQPGGSRRDADSIAAADAAGIAMVFTGRRHFRH